MKKRLCCGMLLMLLVVTLFPAAVFADTGPKPSVIVDFTGLDGESYYVTLLSEKESTGPWYKSDEYEEWYENELVWQKMNDYPDADGYYFIGCFDECTSTHRFEWNYYPPYKFKILIYLPESDAFLVTSDTYERYAFKSYYTVQVADIDGSLGLSVAESSTDTEAIMEIGGLSVIRSYDYKWELISLLCRIVLTIILELIIAYFFFFRRRKQIITICIVNVITQTILNVLLNLINYNKGNQAFVFYYVLLELAVFAVEGFIYQRCLRPEEGDKKAHLWLYALLANTASFLIGLLIAHWIPGIF